MVGWCKCWVNFQCRGVLLIRIIEGQGPIVLAVGAGGGCLDIFFSHLSLIVSFSLSQGDVPIQTEILSPRAVKPKQPTNQLRRFNGTNICLHTPASLHRICLSVPFPTQKRTE